MISIPTNYTELNWLNRKDKDIPLPLLVVAPIYHSGMYVLPADEEIQVGERFFPLNKGLILVAEYHDDKEFINTLAHEWRHHWQFHKGLEFDSIRWNEESGKSYKELIVEFFTKSKLESDALMFSNRVAPCDASLEWYEWIILNNTGKSK